MVAVNSPVVDQLWRNKLMIEAEDHEANLLAIILPPTDLISQGGMAESTYGIGKETVFFKVDAWRRVLVYAEDKKAEDEARQRRLKSKRTGKLILVVLVSRLRQIVQGCRYRE